jgi:predicted RNA binding protein YcfA (HicA-like mRNA interferase family)
MPPRVREVVARLRAAGYEVARRGRGDHTIYRHPETNDMVVIDGSPDHEVPKAVWQKLKKRFGWKE